MAKTTKKTKTTKKVVLNDFDDLEVLENLNDIELNQIEQDEIPENTDDFIVEKLSKVKANNVEKVEDEIVDNDKEEEEKAKEDIQNMIKEENEKNKKNKSNFKSAELNREEIMGSESFLKRTKEYIESNEYKKICKKYADKFNVSPKKVENKFLGKMLGAIGDALGFVIDCIEATADLVIKILTYVLLKGISLICKVARALSSIISFNHTLKTC